MEQRNLKTVEVDGRKPEDPPAPEATAAEQETETETDETDKLKKLHPSIFSVKRKKARRNYFIEGVFLQAESKTVITECILKTLAREVAKYDENYIKKGVPLVN